MSKICVFGDWVAVAPFREVLRTETKDFGKGLAVGSVRQQNELTETACVFDSGDIPAGARVWLRGDAHKAPEAANVLEVGGQKFVLIPRAHVRLAEVRQPVFAPPFGPWSLGGQSTPDQPPPLEGVLPRIVG